VDRQDLEEEAPLVVGQAAVGKNSAVTLARLADTLCKDCNVAFYTEDDLETHITEIHDHHKDEISEFKYQLEVEHDKVRDLEDQVIEKTKEIDDLKDKVEELQDAVNEAQWERDDLKRELDAKQ
jgi:septal ring factor EnvC (AmiA/AmiB activator)